MQYRERFLNSHFLNEIVGFIKPLLPALQRLDNKDKKTTEPASRQARTLANTTPLSPSATVTPGSGTNRLFRRRVPVSLSVTHTVTSNTSPRISTRPSPVDTGATGPESGSSRQSRGRVSASVQVTHTPLQAILAQVYQLSLVQLTQVLLDLEVA